MDKNEILRACLELASVSAGIARIIEALAKEEAPRKPPARAGRVIEMKRAG